MFILVENYGFTVRAAHYEYINKKFKMEVTKVEGKYIVRLEKTVRFNLPVISYKLFEDLVDVVGFVHETFTDYGVEEFIL